MQSFNYSYENFNNSYENFNNFLGIEPIKYGSTIISLFSNQNFKSYFFNKFNETYLCIKIKYENNFFLLYSLMKNKEMKEKNKKRYDDFNYNDFFKIRNEKDVRTFFPELDESEIFFSFLYDINNTNLPTSNELLIYKLKEKLYVVCVLGIIKHSFGHETFVRKKDVLYSVDKGEEIEIINSDKFLNFLESLIPVKRNNRLILNVYVRSENTEEFSLFIDFKIKSIDESMVQNIDHLSESEKKVLYLEMFNSRRTMDFFYKIYFCKSNLSSLKRFEKINISREKDSLLLNYGEFSYLKYRCKMVPLFDFDDRYMHRYPKKFREWYFKLICIFKKKKTEKKTKKACRTSSRSTL